MDAEPVTSDQGQKIDADEARIELEIVLLIVLLPTVNVGLSPTPTRADPRWN